MSILEILIPTVLFFALVIMKTEGGEAFSPVYKNETTYPKDTYPEYFCKSLGIDNRLKLLN